MILLNTGTTIILTSTVVFLILILLLVGILLFAKSKLMPSGNLKIIINQEKEYDVPAGENLLSVLGQQKIFVPSACGGQGTCGMCRIKIHDGAGEILPTEEGFFTRKEQKENWRLACQVKVKQEMNIEIDKDILGVKKWECEVVSNKNVATFIKEFVVKLPEGETLDFRSGGYVQIDVPKFSADFKNDFDIEDEYRDEWDKFNMWELNIDNKEETFRAYSMANHPAEGNIVMLNIRIATPPWDRKANAWTKGIQPGICSSYVFSRKPGDKVTISGPYGEFFLRDTKNEKMFIGGGAGMAPMRSHIFQMFHTDKSDVKTTFWYGARSKREIFYEDDFENIKKDFDNFDYTIALSEPAEEDNWTGKTGFIHQVIYDEYLSKHETPEDIEYYLCGPPLMIDAVKKMLYDLGVPDENVMFDDFGS